MPDTAPDEIIRGWLNSKTDPAIIRRHPQTGLEYLPWSAKWRTVKHAFPRATMRITEHWSDEDGFNVVVYIEIPGGDGSLFCSLPGLGFEPRQKGAQTVRFSDSGYKSALSDAVARACVLLGVGLDLYDNDTPASTAAPSPQPATQPVPQPATQPVPVRRQTAAVPEQATSPIEEHPICPIHQKMMHFLPGGISKKTGQPYNARYTCPIKDAAGNYCSTPTIWMEDEPPAAPDDDDEVPF